MERVIEAFRGRMDVNVDASADRIVAARLPFYMRLSRDQLRAILRRAFEMVLRDLEFGGPRDLPKLMTALGAERSQQGVAIVDIMTGLDLGFQAVTEDFAAVFADDPLARLYWEQGRSLIAYAGAVHLAGAYLAAREKVVRAQADEIVQLSTRVLPLYPGVLVLPLLGQLTGERAEQITQVLLAAVADNRCKFALIDLSGLARVDADVAGLLMRAALAVQLLGATAVFVGVGPAAARAMVECGVALDRLTVLADLAAGLRFALERLGVRLIEP